jgi:alkylation response protein AidB-like acyl-CoA dehydrogenase
MDIGDSPEEAAFRAEARAFLEAHATRKTPGVTSADELNRHDPNWMWEHIERCREWQHVLCDSGWAGITWPKEFGGRGGTGIEQAIYSEEESQFDVVSGVFTVGIGMVAPTLTVHATPGQQQRYLDPMLRGDELWCQLFSEPGAGSDLATLGTRAVRDGDQFVVDGQKVWNSYAQYADWGILLARTDPGAPKHRGISFLLMDIKSPGISIRPLIDAAWEHRVNETFFEDVRVPARNRLGEENRGWYVAVTLLDFERSAISGAVGLRRSLKGLLEYVGTEEGRSRSRLASLPTLRVEVADRFVEIEVTFNLSLRIASMQSRALVPNYEASMGKLFSSETGHRLWRLGTKVFGLYSNLWDSADPRSPLRAEFTQTYVRSIPSTIGGGSSEIQRNIIATRGLGLPRG